MSLSSITDRGQDRRIFSLILDSLSSCSSNVSCMSPMNDGIEPNAGKLLPLGVNGWKDVDDPAESGPPAATALLLSPLNVRCRLLSELMGAGISLTIACPILSMLSMDDPWACFLGKNRPIPSPNDDSAIELCRWCWPLWKSWDWLWLVDIVPPRLWCPRPSIEEESESDCCRVLYRPRGPPAPPIAIDDVEA